MEESRPTWYTAVPTMHQTILSRAGNNKAIIAANPLRCCGHDVDERLGGNPAFESLNCEQAGRKRLGQHRRVKGSLCLLDE